MNLYRIDRIITNQFIPFFKFIVKDFVQILVRNFVYMLGKIYFYLKLTIVIDNNLMLPLSWNEICLECDCIYSRLMNMFHNT